MKKTLLTAVCALSTISAASAVMVARTAFEDITLDSGDGNQDSRTHLLVGDNSAASPYHSLLAFDLSGIVTLNPGESIIVNSVTLTLNEDSLGGGAGDFTMTVSEYDFDFDPTTSTYAAPAAGDTTAGGTAGTSLGSIAGVNGTNADTSWTLATSAGFQTEIAAALTAGDADYGILLEGENNTDVHFVRLSRSNAQLNIDYTVVPEPSSTALLGLGGLALILRRRK